MAKNKYIWLYENYRMYEYHTDEAKSLRDEISGIDMSDEFSTEPIDNLKACYEKLLKLFENNPFNYITDFNDPAITSSNMDGYFVQYGEEPIPIGFFREDNPFECKIVTEQFLASQTAANAQRSGSTKSWLKRTSNRIYSTLTTIKENGKNDRTLASFPTRVPSFPKAVTVLAASALTLISVIMYVLRTKTILTPIKGIIKPSAFVGLVHENYTNVPFFDGCGSIIWIIFLVISVLLTIYSVRRILASVREIKDSKKWKDAEAVIGEIDEYISYSDGAYTDYIECCMRECQTALDMGNNFVFQKGNFALRTAEIRKKAGESDNYAAGLKNNVAQRPILSYFPKKKNIMTPVVIAVLSTLILGFMAAPSYKLEQGTVYDIKKVMYNITLKVNDYYTTNINDLYVYRTRNIDSKKKVYMKDPGVTLIKLSEKEDKAGNSWSKVIYDDGNRFVKGWVLTKYMTKNYSEIRPTKPISASTFDANVDSEYVWTVLDGDKGSYWSNKNANSARISMGFGGVRHKICGVRIYGGYGGSKDDYNAHARVKRMRIHTEKNEVDEVLVYDYFDAPQIIWFNKPVESSNLTVDVEEVYGGTADSVVYIGECVPLEYAD